MFRPMQVVYFYKSRTQPFPRNHTYAIISSPHYSHPNVSKIFKKVNIGPTTCIPVYSTQILSKRYLFCIAGVPDLFWKCARHCQMWADDSCWYDFLLQCWCGCLLHLLWSVGRECVELGLPGVELLLSCTWSLSLLWTGGKEYRKKRINRKKYIEREK